MNDPRLSLFEEGFPKTFDLIHAVQTQEVGDDQIADFLTDEVSFSDDPHEADPDDPGAKTQKRSGCLIICT